jgi:hypothetical protein
MIASIVVSVVTAKIFTSRHFSGDRWTLTDFLPVRDGCSLIGSRAMEFR